MIAELLAEFGRQGRTLAVAESLTGGALAAAIVSVPGASQVFRGGVVAYATAAKEAVLGVDGGLLAARGAVDPAVAVSMAERVAAIFGAEVGVATTGVAGPEPQDGRAPGTVFIAAVDVPAGEQRVQELSLAGDRNAIRSATVAAAVEMIAKVCASGASG